MIFSLLPYDVIHHILSYNNRIKYRNGKYMNQICNDKRYKLLLRIPPVIASMDYIHVYDVCYRPTDSSLCVDLEDGNIIYTFVTIVKNNLKNIIYGLDWNNIYKMLLYF